MSLKDERNYLTAKVTSKTNELLYSSYQSVCYTFVTEIVHHDYLMQELFRGHLNDTVYRPHQGRPSFIVEDQDDTGSGQVLRVVPVLTSSRKRLRVKVIGHNNTIVTCD